MPRWTVWWYRWGAEALRVVGVGVCHDLGSLNLDLGGGAEADRGRGVQARCGMAMFVS